MDKYKNFLLLFCCIVILLFWSIFPICFDNNDDFVMQGICSGTFSGIATANLVLINIFLGKFLYTLFFIFNTINWYALFLQIVLLICFFTSGYLFMSNKIINSITSTLFILFLLLGLYFICIVKLQFTTVALFCCFTGLLCLIKKENNKHSNILFALFIIVAFLIRKDTFYISIVFAIPILLTDKNELNTIRKNMKTTVFVCFIFVISLWFNNISKEYKEYQTYSKTNSIDIIAAKPTSIKSNVLIENKLSVDDIVLLQHWFMADEAYLTGKKIEHFAKSIKGNRNTIEIISELKKFATDERYILLVYFITIVFILFFSKKNIKLCLLNLSLFLLLLLYLTITSRIPHRVTFPIISYLSLANIFVIFKSNNNTKMQLYLLCLLFVISNYKAYCTSKLYKIQTVYHDTFNKYTHEINQHPKTIFIALDAFPVQYADAWKSSKNIFPAHNIILSGWYACTPDYQHLLDLHQLKNLTIDLKNRNDILFLTNDITLQTAYINVMKQRYNLNCHFENTTGFTYLNPKKLVFDN